MDENAIEIRVQQELQKILADPDKVIEAYQRVLEKRDAQIADLRPKAEIWEIAMGSESLIEMSAAAKTLNFKGMGRNNLFDYLRNNKILRYNNEPYQQYVDSGYFKIIEQNVTLAGYDGYTVTNRKTMVTQKGLDYICKRLLEDSYELNARQ
jgi:anti-repressor protein